MKQSIKQFHNIPIILQFILIMAFTGLGCFAVYDLIIKRTGSLRLLFGLKASKRYYSGLPEQKGGLTVKTDHLTAKADPAKIESNIIT